jgi:hypothetical protein
MIYNIFELLHNLFDLSQVSLSKMAKHWNGFLSHCISSKDLKIGGMPRLNKSGLEPLPNTSLGGLVIMPSISASFGHSPMPLFRGQTHKPTVTHLPTTLDGWSTSMTTQQNISDSLIGEMNFGSEPMVSFAWKQNSKEGVVLRSVTIPFKNLIQHLSFYSLSPANQPSSSLI